MKRFVVAGLVVVSLLDPLRSAEEKFTATLPPEELAAMGLTGLTPAQLARLDTLVEAYKSGALTSARRVANEALAAKLAAEVKAARAEAKMEAATAEAAKPASSSGLIGKAKNLLKSSPKAEVEAVESSVPGKFHGWEPRQIFTLANGQRWQVANRDSYYSPVVENPRVQIVPAAFAGHWLRFPELNVEVRVNFLGDE